jgi:hypothetical protein
MKAASLQVPLMIGVTGHRDLLATEVPVIEQAVERFFLDLQKRFPALPMLVTTPLAEGADRLVARVARRLEIPLNILLPMPRELYQKDFEGMSAESFEEMLSLGEIIELPLLPGLDAARELPEGAARDAQYEYLGIYLAAHSHILLALWDGKPSSAPGGTAQVVRFHQQNVVRLISGVQARSAIDFSEDESDLAYHIACSRAGNGGPTEGLASGEGAWLTRDDVQPRTATLPERYQAVFRQQGQLNRDLAAAHDWLPATNPEAGSEEAVATGELVDLAEAVDALAVRFQRLALRALRALYVLAALAGVSFIVYADLPDQEPMIWAYLAFLAVGFALYVLERRGAWYRRYVDYRGLAQGLRIQSYWAMAGVHMENPTEFPHDRFMRREELSLGWIRNVMRYGGRRSDAAVTRPSEASLGTVMDHWIRDQNDYYARGLRERLAHARTTSRLSTVGFTLGLCAAVVLALFQKDLTPPTVSFFIAAMVGLPYLAAVRTSYAERICERELIAQYAHMDRIYANAYRLLMATQDQREIRSILRALGEEALQEVGQWILRQRERPISGDRLFRSG